MRLSVIVPALNEAAIIREFLPRARALQPDELIVCDGGSDDGTVELAEGLGCRVISSPRGRGIQLRHGAEAASGDMLLFLHVDTWLDASAREQLDAAWRNSTVVAGAFLQRIDADGFAYRILERGNAWRARRLGMAYGDQGIFMRRAVLEEIGGVPPIPLMEDVELMRRLRRVGRLNVLPGPLYVNARRWRRHGLARQTARNWLLLSAFFLGVTPERLASMYPPAR